MGGDGNERLGKRREGRESEWAHGGRSERRSGEAQKTEPAQSAGMKIIAKEESESQGGEKQSVWCLRAVGFRFETGPIGTRKRQRLSQVVCAGSAGTGARTLAGKSVGTLRLNVHRLKLYAEDIIKDTETRTKGRNAGVSSVLDPECSQWRRSSFHIDITVQPHSACLYIARGLHMHLPGRL